MRQGKEDVEAGERRGGGGGVGSGGERLWREAVEEVEEEVDLEAGRHLGEV